VDSKRTTAAYCIRNVVYSFSVVAGGPVAALIADQTGSYIYSFFTTGGVPLTASLIPIILIFINRGKFKVHPRSMGVEEAKEEKVDTVSKEVQTEQAHEFGMKPRSGTFTRMCSSSAIL